MLRSSFLYLSILAPTVNFQVGNIGDLPLLMNESIKPDIEKMAQECIALSKADWDDQELSWDFTMHPFVRLNQTGKLSDIFDSWKQLTDNRYQRLKQLYKRKDEQ